MENKEHTNALELIKLLAEIISVLDEHYVSLNSKLLMQELQLTTEILTLKTLNEEMLFIDNSFKTILKCNDIGILEDLILRLKIFNEHVEIAADSSKDYYDKSNLFKVKFPRFILIYLNNRKVVEDVKVSCGTLFTTDRFYKKEYEELEAILLSKLEPYGVFLKNAYIHLQDYHEPYMNDWVKFCKDIKKHDKQMEKLIHLMN